MRACLLIVTLVASGCVTVRPYEREHLAHPAMSFAPEDGPDPHMLESREGSSGGTGNLGSGCGCN